MVTGRRKPLRREALHKVPATYPRLAWLVLFLSAAVFVFTCLQLDFTQDDAYISFRYAANLLAGEGLTYNAGERVEGYTNFLWVILLALFKAIFKIDYVISSRLLGVSAGLMIFFLGFIMAKYHSLSKSLLLCGALAVMLLSNLPLAYWSIASLETSLFACLTFAVLVAEYRRPRLSPALAVIATLLRPEGALLFGVVFIHRLATSRRLPSSYLLMYFLLLLPFALFKLFYYGSLVPNPYYAKSGVGLEYIQSGLNYVWYFTRTLGVYGLVFLLPLLAIKRLWNRYSLLYLFVLVYILYIIWVGGDVLKAYRFFVPVVAPLYFLFAVSLLELAGSLIRSPRVAYSLCLVGVLGFSTGSLLFSYEHVNTYRGLEKIITGKMHFVATMLKKHMGEDFSLAASTIGMIGYQLPGHRVIDMLGLTDPQIARHPETIEGIASSWKERRFNNYYLLTQQPDFILFSTNYKPSAPAERALMLHSEFRRRYSPIAFYWDINFAVIWMRTGEVDISADRVHDDIRFMTNLNEGIYLMGQGFPDSALVCFQESHRRLAEDYPILLFNIGVCLLKTGQEDSAVVYLERAAMLDPYCWEARLQLMHYAAQGGDSAAVAYHRAYLREKFPWLLDRGYRPPD